MRHWSLFHFLLFEEFIAPVYNQIHQEQIVAGMTTQHRVENPAVQDQVVEGYRNEFLIPSKCFHMSVYNSTPLYKVCTCQSRRSRS